MAQQELSSNLVLPTLTTFLCATTTEVAGQPPAVRDPDRKVREKSLDLKPKLAVHGCNELSHLKVFRVYCLIRHYCWGEEYLASHCNSERDAGVQHHQKLIHSSSNLGPFCLFGVEQWYEIVKHH